MSEIYPYFSFQNKLNDVSRTEMGNIDNLLVKAKMSELKIDINYTKFPSLCFTLEESVVKDIFRRIGKTFKA